MKLSETALQLYAWVRSDHELSAVFLENDEDLRQCRLQAWWDGDKELQTFIEEPDITIRDYRLQAWKNKDKELSDALQVSPRYTIPYYNNLIALAEKRNDLRLAHYVVKAHIWKSDIFERYKVVAETAFNMAIAQNNLDMADSILCDYKQFPKPRGLANCVTELLDENFIKHAPSASVETMKWLSEYQQKEWRRGENTTVVPAIFGAIGTNNIPVIEFLATKRFEINHRNYHADADWHDGHGIEMVLQAAKGNIHRNVHNVMLQQAVRENRGTIIGILFNLGAEVARDDPLCMTVNEQLRPQFQHQYKRQLAFCNAAGSGDMFLVKKELAAGMSPYLWDNEPQNRAAEKDDLAMLKLFEGKISFSGELIKKAAQAPGTKVLYYLTRQIDYSSRLILRENLNKYLSELMNENKLSAAAQLLPVIEGELDHAVVGPAFCDQITKNPAFPADFPLIKRRPYWINNPSIIETIIKADRSDIIGEYIKCGITIDPQLIFKSGKRSFCTAIFNCSEQEPDVSAIKNPSQEVNGWIMEGLTLLWAAKIDALSAITPPLEHTNDYLPYTSQSIEEAVKNDYVDIAEKLITYKKRFRPNYSPETALLHQASSDAMLAMLVEHGGKDDARHQLMIKAIDHYYSAASVALAKKLSNIISPFLQDHFQQKLQKGDNKAVALYTGLPVKHSGAVVISAEAGQAETVALLISIMPDSSIQYKIAAEKAAHGGWWLTLQVLLDSGHVHVSHFNNKLPEDISPHRLIIDRLLERGLVVGNDITPALRQQIDHGQHPGIDLTATHLIAAAAYGLMPVVKYSAESMDQESLDKAVFAAAKADRHEIVEWLVDKGASPVKALEGAIYGGYSESVDRSLSKPFPYDMSAMMVAAILSDRADMTRKMLKACWQQGIVCNVNSLLAQTRKIASPAVTVLNEYQAWKDMPEGTSSITGQGCIPTKTAMQRLWEVGAPALDAATWKSLPDKWRGKISVSQLKTKMAQGGVQVLQDKELPEDLTDNIGSFLSDKDALAVAHLSRSSMHKAQSYVEKYRPGGVLAANQKYRGLLR